MTMKIEFSIEKLSDGSFEAVCLTKYGTEAGYGETVFGAIADLCEKLIGFGATITED